VWLDDLFVDEHARGRGAATELMRALAALAVEQGCPRMEWVTAASNGKAIAFYERMGAKLQHTIRACRLDEQALETLAGAGADAPSR
jgi:ribosomal protein S18 acetylase RimI-like enzyme